MYAAYSEMDSQFLAHNDVLEQRDSMRDVTEL